MSRPARLFLVALASAVLASAVFVLAASGDSGKARGNGDRGHSGGGALLRSSLAPSVPADPGIHGVAAGGAPWVLDRGKVELRGNGRLKLRVRGLVIPNPPGDGTPGAVETISASLFCGADTTPAVDTTAPVPLDDKGDARIRETLDLPAKCLAPIVLVHPNDTRTRYIAASGFVR